MFICGRVSRGARRQIWACRAQQTGSNWMCKGAHLIHHLPTSVQGDAVLVLVGWCAGQLLAVKQAVWFTGRLSVVQHVVVAVHCEVLMVHAC